MTKIRFGDQYDTSKSTLDITAAGNSKTEIGVGNLYDRSERAAKIKDSSGKQRRSSGWNAGGDNDKSKHETHRFNVILALGFAVILMGAILALAVLIQNPTPFQVHVFSVVLALAAGGFASVLSGALNVRLNLTRKVAIGATGALAVFVVVYFFVPAAAH